MGSKATWLLLFRLTQGLSEFFALLFHVDPSGVGAAVVGVPARVDNEPNIEPPGIEDGSLQVEDVDVIDGTPLLDIKPYERDGLLVSSTGQLRWKEGKSKLDGYIMIDADATKAVVGFANGQSCKLGNVTITPHCKFAAIYVTAKEKDDKDVATARKLLVVAMARARNTGMKINEAGDRLIERGGPPILLEPVKATISIDRPGNPKVELLDHDGLPTGKTLPVKDGTFTIDGAADKTPYYLITY